MCVCVCVCNSEIYQDTMIFCTEKNSPIIRPKIRETLRSARYTSAINEEANTIIMGKDCQDGVFQNI